MRISLRFRRQGGAVMAAVVLFIVAVVMLITSVIFFMRDNNKKNRCAQSAVATVIDYEEHWIHDRETPSHYSYYPVLSYTVNGYEHQCVSNYGTNPPMYELGDRLDIMYNAENPGEFYIVGNPGSVILCMVFGVIGISLLALAVGLVVLKLSRRI